MSTKELAQLLMGRRIVSVSLQQQPSGEICVEWIKFHDGTRLELRGENGYASNAVATLVPARAE